jgi:hypothetical protein
MLSAGGSFVRAGDAPLPEIVARGSEALPVTRILGLYSVEVVRKRDSNYPPN